MDLLQQTGAIFKYDAQVDDCVFVNLENQERTWCSEKQLFHQYSRRRMVPKTCAKLGGGGDPFLKT